MASRSYVCPQNQATMQQSVLDQALQASKALLEQLEAECTEQHQAVLGDLMCPITCELMDDPVIAEDATLGQEQPTAPLAACTPHLLQKHAQ
jgi:DNA-binding transcriptional regulator YbjK